MGRWNNQLMGSDYALDEESELQSSIYMTYIYDGNQDDYWFEMCYTPEWNQIIEKNKIEIAESFRSFALPFLFIQSGVRLPDKYMDSMLEMTKESDEFDYIDQRYLDYMKYMLSEDYNDEEFVTNKMIEDKEFYEGILSVYPSNLFTTNLTHKQFVKKMKKSK